MLSRAQVFYNDPALRKFAPPVLLFPSVRLVAIAKDIESSQAMESRRILCLSHSVKKKRRIFYKLSDELALFRLDTEMRSLIGIGLIFEGMSFRLTTFLSCPFRVEVMGTGGEAALESAVGVLRDTAL